MSEEFRLPPKCNLGHGLTRRCERLGSANKSLNEAHSVINGLNRELEGMRRQISELQEKLQAFKEFPGNIAHDLRTPLTKISGYAGLLAGKDKGMDISLDITATHELIVMNARLMQESIEDIGYTFRMTPDKLNVHPQSLSDLAHGIFNGFVARERTMAFEFKFQPDLAAKYDIHPVRLALFNLIKNAVKFSGGRSPIKVEFGYNAEKCAFFVKDQGVGFDPSESEKLFHKGVRLNSAKLFEGSGTGLMMVKSAIDLHGGKVWAESEGVGKGATFYFTLPQTV